MSFVDVLVGGIFFVCFGEATSIDTESYPSAFRLRSVGKMTLPEPIKLKTAGGTYYECPLCQYYSYTRGAAVSHISKCILKIPRKRSSDMDDIEQPKEKISRTEPTSIKDQKVSEKFRCKYCQIMFSSKKERNTHHRKVHPSGEVVKTRDELQSSTSTALALVDDVKTSDVALINDEDDILPDLVPEPVIEWKCSSCEFKSTSRQNIIEHKEASHQLTYTKFCEKCPFTTSNDTSYVNHW